MATHVLPSFDDIRNMFNFWIDQENKWFYFETATLKAGSNIERDVYNPLHMNTTVATEYGRESVDYVQDRIVGRISDVIPYPPSLLLLNSSIFSVKLDILRGTKSLVKCEKRETYGLVFSQITYYEPIKNLEVFLKDDPRISEPEDEE